MRLTAHFTRAELGKAMGNIILSPNASIMPYVNFGHQVLQHLYRASAVLFTADYNEARLIPGLQPAKPHHSYVGSTSATN